MGYLTASGSAPDEKLRSDRLQSYAVINTARDATIDRIVFTAAQLFRVPMAVISLLDGDRLWVKAQVGVSVQDTSLDMAFCSEMLKSDGVLVIEDASRDPRFVNHPLVTGEPFIRFYAGAPLITPDRILVGALCVADRVPKSILSRQAWQLSSLAGSVVAALESRRP